MWNDMFIEISFCPVHDGDGGQKQISPEAGNVPTWQFATHLPSSQ